MANTALGAERQKDEHISYLSDEIIELMLNMGSVYSDYSNMVHAVYKKLKQEVIKYLDENELWKDEETILNISHHLPNSGMYQELTHALYNILESGEDKQSGIEQSNLTPEMIETLKIMRRAYNRNFEKASRVEEKMRKHINRYMDEHNLWKNQKAIIEVIEVLPAGYLRFKFYKTYYDLEDKKSEIPEEK